jgi:hypothetical protein
MRHAARPMARHILACALGALALALAVPAMAAEAAPEAEAAQSGTGLSGSVFVDPLGLLMFGPTAGLELGVCF